MGNKVTTEVIDFKTLWSLRYNRSYKTDNMAGKNFSHFIFFHAFLKSYPNENRDQHTWKVYKENIVSENFSIFHTNCMNG